MERWRDGEKERGKEGKKEREREIWVLPIDPYHFSQ